MNLLALHAAPPRIHLLKLHFGNEAAPEEQRWVTIQGRHHLIGADGHILIGPLKHWKPSTKAQTSAKVTPAHENDVPTHAEREGNGSHPYESADVATRDELGRIARANSWKRWTGQTDTERVSAQGAGLAKVREQRPELATRPDFSQKIGEGNEHIVTHDKRNPGFVLKHTVGGFGYVVDMAGDKAVLREATPEEYLHRIDGQNALFGDDMKLAGIAKVRGRIGLTVSQPVIQGKQPNEPKIHQFMEGIGYRPVKEKAFGTAHLRGKTWFNPESHIMVSDVKPDNFKETQDGHITPIDLWVQQLHPKSTLAKHLLKHLA